MEWCSRLGENSWSRITTEIPSLDSRLTLKVASRRTGRYPGTAYRDPRAWRSLPGESCSSEIRGVARCPGSHLMLPTMQRRMEHSKRPARPVQLAAAPMHHDWMGLRSSRLPRGGHPRVTARATSSARNLRQPGRVPGMQLSELGRPLPKWACSSDGDRIGRWCRRPCALQHPSRRLRLHQRRLVRRSSSLEWRKPALANGTS